MWASAYALLTDAGRAPRLLTACPLALAQLRISEVLTDGTCRLALLDVTVSGRRDDRFLVAGRGLRFEPAGR